MKSGKQNEASPRCLTGLWWPCPGQQMARSLRCCLEPGLGLWQRGRGGAGISWPAHPAHLCRGLPSRFLPTELSASRFSGARLRSEAGTWGPAYVLPCRVPPWDLRPAAQRSAGRFAL